MQVQNRFESSKEFKPVWENLPVGSIVWKVKTYNGNTGKCVGIEYTLDSEDLSDMKEVSNGYFTETYKMIK